jgi:hypothetical protein
VSYADRLGDAADDGDRGGPSMEDILRLRERDYDLRGDIHKPLSQQSL